nr:putative RNA-directed DNA polymerase, eukaryota, reverse transcriptase zinc-binding domain protein [Tanacetum cinerariifolium]
KRFAFVRFIKVENVDRVVDNLCTIWLGRFCLHANVVRFQRESRNTVPQPYKRHVGNPSSSFASILKSGMPKQFTFDQSSPALVLDDSYLIDRDFSMSFMGKVKELSALPNLYFLLEKEEGLPLKGWSSNTFVKVAPKWGELVDREDFTGGSFAFKCICVKIKVDEIISERFKVIVQGVGHKTKRDWVKELCMKHRVNFMTLQETKMESMDLVTIKALWGNLSFDYAYSPSVGNSGGILCVWEPSLFVKENVSSFDYFLVVMGTWIPSSTKLFIISVYAPQELTEKKELWDYLHLLIDKWECFDKLVEDTWLNSNIEDSNDKILDQRGSSEDILNTRSTLLKELDDINTVDSLEKAQKAKIRWAIKGDENSKYFHDILNKKRSQLAIRGILAQGDWIADPHLVKNEFLTHFSNRFSMPGSFRIYLVERFTNRLSSDQKEDLERNVTLNEIKSAVWDCGTNKYPGLDGFTFDFFRRYWKFFEQDIMAAVTEFFSSGVFPSGCNYSFIALISKIQDAKAVHDFRPISLIGSLYKIITKISSMRLSLVISDRINDVQSAFVTNRQILDGPFILNELLSWCKHKKMKAMFFKSAMGSVLVNGNPTMEFKFHKGLKQGDPLSPFFFILVMESLHLSFRRVMDASLFSGISINNSLTISNLFYADDDVFFAMDSFESISRRSPWLDIVRETKSLIKKGIDLLAFVRKKIGNGENSLFWDDICDSLVFSFRRIPRGRIEEEQQRSLQARIEGIILAPMSDR